VPRDLIIPAVDIYLLYSPNHYARSALVMTELV
jgi:hypothetical protein